MSTETANLASVTNLTSYEVAKMQQQYATLSKHPHLQAESIAHHYAAHASIAMDMMKAVEMRRYSPSPQLDEMIANLAKVIIENHRNEFGIELDWTSKPQPQ